MRNTTKPRKSDSRKIAHANFVVAADLYFAFKQVCAKEDITFSQMLRRYMRETVDAHETVEEQAA